MQFNEFMHFNEIMILNELVQIDQTFKKEDEEVNKNNF